MAYEFRITPYPPYQGRPTFTLEVYVRRETTDVPNKRSTYYYALIAHNTTGSSASWTATNYGWSITLTNTLGGSYTYTGSHSLDFRGGQSTIVLGTGYTGWFNHGSNGALTINVGAQHGPASVFGLAAGTGTFVTDSILSVPNAPTFAPFSPNPDQITTNSMRVRFQSGGGGAATSWQLQYSTSSNFSSNVTTVASTGTTTVTGLTPATVYYFRARGVNAAGNGPYSSTINAQTLPTEAPGLSISMSPSGTSATATMSPPQGYLNVDSYTLEWEYLSPPPIPFPVGGSREGASPQTVQNLQSGATYRWRSRANIGLYHSPFTDWQSHTQPQPSTNPGEYFDGSTTPPGGSDVTYAWTGTANNSTSNMNAQAPTGWLAFQAGASGATGAVMRATGGLFGDFAARCVFFTDEAAAGSFAGPNANTSPFSLVTAGVSYNASIHVNPSRTQRLGLRIAWYNGGGTLLSTSLTASFLLSGGVWARLGGGAVAPAGAVRGVPLVYSVAGTGYTPWQGGEFMLLDGAMMTMGELLPYFDGATPDTPQFDFDWTGTANASASTRTPLPQEYDDPLRDPLCPPVPAPPRPPIVLDECIDDTGVWRRFWITVPPSDVSSWLSMVKTLVVRTGSAAINQMRVRVYDNHHEEEAGDYLPEEWESEQIISYIPPHTEFTLDGVTERAWADVDGAGAVPADHLLYGTGGRPPSWTTLECGISYLIALDVPTAVAPGAFTAEMALTTRM